MNTMWKFPLQLVDGRQPTEMPVGAIALHVAMQDGMPCVWAWVDPEKSREYRGFAVIGTGNKIPDGAVYVGSCMDRCFVWHIFETAKV